MAQIYISIGSNIDRERHVRLGLDELHRRFGPLTVSRVFESEAVGFDGDDFYNLVVGVETGRNVEEVVAELKAIEAHAGRDPRSKGFSSRTLDLDLLSYDDLICEAPVDLPRPEILKNAFVLWPLSDIAPDHIHPLAGQTYRELWRGFDQNSQALEPIVFDWQAPERSS